MKDFKEEHIDPEQYWPEAEKLLEQHYAAKRRRRFVVLFCLVLMGVLSVYLINSRKENYSEKVNPATIEKGVESSMSNRNHIDGEAEKVLPSNEKVLVEDEKQVHRVANTSSTTNEKAEVVTPVESTSSLISEKPLRTQQEVEVINTEANSSLIFKDRSTPKTKKAIALEMESKEQSKNSTSQEVVLPNPELNFSDIDYINLLPLLKWKGTEKEELSFRSDDRPTLETKKKTKWDLIVYGGVNSVQKEFSGKSSASYLKRREKEELPAVLPFGGLQLSKSIGNWDFRGGFELSVIGEHVKYTPYSNGQYLNVYDSWQPNNYIVTDTDSAYIWGVLFLNTSNHIVLDSVKVTTTDTLNGTHYNSSVQLANGINRWYVLELPLEVLYQYRMKRWGFGVAASLAPGLVVQSSGYYLKEDESGYASIKKYNKQQFTLNARVGLEVSYLLNTRCRLLLRPTSQYSITKMEAGVNQKQRYQRNGVSLGLLYMIP